MFRLSRLVAALLTLILLFNLGLTSAFAAGPNWASGRNDTGLEKALVARTSDMREVAHRLALAQTYDGQVDTLVLDLQSKGFDVTPIQESCMHFEVHLANIGVRLTEANALIETRPGFDARGKVVNSVVAERTIARLNELRKGIWDYSGDIYTDMERGFNTFDKMYPDTTYVKPASPASRSMIS